MTKDKQDVRVSIIDAVLGGLKLFEASRTYYNTNRIRVRERTIYSGFPNHVYSSPFSGKALFKWRDHDYRADIPYTFNLANYDQKSLTFAQANALLDLHWQRRYLPDELGKSQKGSVIHSANMRGHDDTSQNNSANPATGLVEGR